MRILVINGSPKGERSVTLKTLQFLEVLHPEHTFETLHAAARIQNLEQSFSPAADSIRRADLLIFAYPVYTFLAPAQLHRFIELMRENQIDLSGVPVTQITTSKRFFDVTAHSFVEENLLDLGAQTFEGLSADMEDLLSEKGRAEARAYFDTLVFQIDNRMGHARPAHEHCSPEPYISQISPVSKTSDRVVALVSFVGEADSNLREMILDFQAALPFEIRAFDMKNFAYRGGCVGCLRCAQDGRCVYTDGFQELLRNRIETCDAVVYAFPVRDHFTYSEMKTYNDRQFCNGHRSTTAGSPVGYIISGRYAFEPNLRTVIQARAAAGGNYLAGVATDETNPQKAIENLAKSLSFAMERNVPARQNFYGVGGGKIFRDLVYKMQGIMRADHEFFREQGLYEDFPQNDKKTIRAMKLVGALMRSNKIRPKILAEMDKQILAPYEKVLQSAAEDDAQ